jgi:hypothetical protein
MKKHNERCKECKLRVVQLLNAIYGDINVFQNYNVNLPNRISELPENKYSSNLEQIFLNLQNYRENKEFVKAKKLPNVDYYVRNQFILEFDESQHFTKPRQISLENYPDDLKIGFDKYRWKQLSLKINKRDNDPPYRDEQRAWYDTLRDFASTYLNLEPTIRIYASDYIWCSLNTSNRNDIKTFKNLILK